MTSTLLQSINDFGTIPISFNYQKPNHDKIVELKKQHQVCIIQEELFIKPINIYYQEKMAGTQPIVYTREAIKLRLKRIATLLAPTYGLYIYDAYRTIDTQKALYSDFFKNIQEKHPDWSNTEVEKETRKFVSHPTDSTHFKIPLHNSGGAIDLALFNTATNQPLAYGSEFDELSEFSRTDFFEQDYDASYDFTAREWQTFRYNRRVLFNVMKAFDFINFRNEWWHYDLGDCYWAQQLNIDWFFESMDELLLLPMSI